MSEGLVNNQSKSAVNKVDVRTTAGETHVDGVPACLFGVDHRVARSGKPWRDQVVTIRHIDARVEFNSITRRLLADR